MTLSYVAYFQPKIDLPKNFDLIQSLELENRITKNFSLVISLSYDYDSNHLLELK